MVHKYKLLHGVHSQGKAIFYPGDVFENEKDITKTMNIPGVVPRVQVLSSSEESSSEPTEESAVSTAVEEAPQEAPVEDTWEGEEVIKPEDDGLQKLTVAQLKETANDMELDITGVMKKDALINLIRIASD